MSTSAIITMVIVQGSVTAIALYIYYLVMHPPKDKNDSQFNND